MKGILKQPCPGMNLTLFLDFDGVVHPQPCFRENVFCRLPLLEDVLREFSEVNIVISSSWREHYGLAELKDFFSQDIAPRVIDVTPFYRDPAFDHLKNPPTDFERQWEIEAWCDENQRHASNWIAIDDYAPWFEPDCPNLLVTSSKSGFTRDDQASLRAMIKARLP
jgi:hypothetical protein